MTSIGTMVKRIEGLVGTTDATKWESEFIQSIVWKTDHGRDTSYLTEKQLEVVQRIHNKHFAG